MARLLALALLALAACSGPDARYLLDTSPAPVQTTRLGVSTLEVRDVSLPAYAEDSQILSEGADGGLSPISGAIWADDPVRAVTLRLADHIGRASTASVAPEPWPLETDPQAAVHVTVTQMVARASGQIDLSGQFAISSYDRIVRERIKRFDISVPLADTNPATIARASSMAMAQLGDAILAELRR